MTERHWATDYIGRPWLAAACGPEAFNCWTFFAWVQREHFGRHLPSFDFVDAASQVRAFTNDPERRYWQAVSTGAEGDGVLMRRHRLPSHVGVWIQADGRSGVLHCAETSGVCFQDAITLRSHGWTIEGIYRYVKGQNQ